jgi:hypothetical protein
MVAARKPSIVRRPFLLCRARLFGQHALEPFSDCLDLRFQQLYFPMLPKYHVAQLGHCAFEIGNLGLDSFQGLIVHRG